MKHRRSIKLILPGLQLKLVGAFVGLFALALVMQFLLLTSALMQVASTLPNDGVRLIDELGPLIRGVMLASAGALLPITLLVGILTTHRFAGPVYRLMGFLSDVAAGKRPPDCKLRKGDELQELCDLVNAATAPLRRRGPEEAPAEQRSVPAENTGGIALEDVPGIRPGAAPAAEREVGTGEKRAG